NNQLHAVEKAVLQADRVRRAKPRDVERMKTDDVGWRPHIEDVERLDLAFKAGDEQHIDRHQIKHGGDEEQNIERDTTPAKRAARGSDGSHQTWASERML